MLAYLPKRKLEDYAEDAICSMNPTRMRKDQNGISPSSHASSCRSFAVQSIRLQFFVRILSDHTLVLQAKSTDTIKSIHEKIQSITGMPLMEQRLIYRGKQLQWDQTLAECKVEKDAGLNLVGRMRSTGHPQAWQLINDLVSLVFFHYKNNPPWLIDDVPLEKIVKSMLLEFLNRTPRNDHEQAPGHLQIFNASSAPAALIMLYMSYHKPNRDAAEDAIQEFIDSSKNVLPQQAYHQFVPIVMEFCRLLSRAAGTGDPLYSLCRSRLGTMIECVDTLENKGLIELGDVFPFVSELAAKLMHDLALSTESNSYVGPCLSDVKAFTAFVVSIMNEMKEHHCFIAHIKVPLSSELCNLPVCYAEELGFLYAIFVDLLNKLHKCLLKVEEHVDWTMKHDDETLYFGCCQYLSILKELNSISKLYNGCKKLFWETMKRRKSALCYLIVRFAKRNDDHKWVIEHREVTNFEARRHLALLMLPEVKYDYEGLHEMLIDRSQLLSESFEYVANAEPESLRSGLFMGFKNEEATGSGVLREWFFLVCQAIFNPQNALFLACPNDRRRFFPSPASKMDHMQLKYFRFAGRIIALAFMHKVQVGIVFDRMFVLLLAGKGILLEDIKGADPYFYSSCKQILEMDAEAVDQDALGLTFVYEIEEMGSMKIVELCPNGRNLVVNSKNRKKYVDSLVQHRFVVSISEQVSHFTQGFTDIINCGRLQRSFFQCLDVEDLDGMLHGSENEISVGDWKAHTEYNGFKETDFQISWFWEVVGKMSAEQKKILLFFWTSIKHLPVEGFSGLASSLSIYKTSEPVDHLPSSHTCFYRLCFPDYPSKTVMHDRLHIIAQEHVGFSFGAW